MNVSEYSGLVYPTAEFKTDSFLISLKESFKSHWRFGHHPDFGKDTLFNRPKEVENHHLRKVHINLKHYQSYTFTSTKECWSDWSMGKIDERGRERPIPTSDAYLIYSVNDRRDASLLAFWYPPAHTKANEPVWIDSVINFSAHFYQKTQTNPMSRNLDPWSFGFKKSKLA
ncbi:type II toxin-antitoxin system YafO family toxin [Yersinia kristensenii]|uniref:Type II toxin-antitoxin system YafO family toxin n=1 Tax=Yersinia kristensenii TaxID=28152 RepID=A0AB73NVW3_YERKR|nr:type II toxin-antitoxin system YafO family toxin [Yersinia kristensenii]OVZ82182.1 hypothetical protein CBW52_05060 [Yersinia kristensenii]